MVEELETTQADFDSIAMMGLDDGFNLAPVELARVLQLGRDKSAKCVSYFIDGELVAIAGFIVECLLDDNAHMWLVTAHAAKRHRVAFARHSKEAQAKLPYRTVSCFCDPSFAHTLRWLEWLGFSRVGEQDIAGRTFITLLREKPHGH